MSDTAFEVKGLGKRYRLHEHRANSLREAFSGLFRRGKKSEEILWAVHDVDFRIRQGEVVGIVGRNGAGKSTLLKLLSRITSPTTGEIRIVGRVGSLLEVGTGFHPDLTGRQNIYLNGAILGMTRAEITRKFDEIVAFSEVEKFLDTMVKHYSSGMYVRLAFAVAAHLEPEILLVDEVLAVGDASFQRKCLNKMEDVGGSGRTVLFVSHNMPSVTRLCPRTILLDKGTVIEDGPSERVVRTYLTSGLGTTADRRWDDEASRPGNQFARLQRVRVRSLDGETVEAASVSEPVGIEITYEVQKPGQILIPNMHLFNQEGTCIFAAIDTDFRISRAPSGVGIHTRTAWIPGHLLSEGSVLVSVALSTFDPVVVHFHEHEAVAFEVVDRTDGTSARGDYAGSLPGSVRPKLIWTEGGGALSPDVEKLAGLRLGEGASRGVEASVVTG